jgi:hypothetical protein
MMNSEKPKKPVDRHSGESRNPGFPVKTGTQALRWFPTFVGTTPGRRFSPVRRLFTKPSMMGKPKKQDLRMFFCSLILAFPNIPIFQYSNIPAIGFERAKQ